MLHFRMRHNARYAAVGDEHNRYKKKSEQTTHYIAR